MKNYMKSGSFTRSKEEENVSEPMVFLGNINQSVESLIKISHLFVLFPPEIANDSVFLIECIITFQVGKCLK